MTTTPRDCTPPPVSEERLRELTDFRGFTGYVESNAMALELLTARTTIAALRKEVDGLLQLQQDGWQLVCESSLVRVTKERDELRRDAGRYKFLREQSTQAAITIECSNTEFSDFWHLSGVDADRAIDAAMAAQLATTPPSEVPHE